MEIQEGKVYTDKQATGPEAIKWHSIRVTCVAQAFYGAEAIVVYRYLEEQTNWYMSKWQFVQNYKEVKDPT